MTTRLASYLPGKFMIGMVPVALTAALTLAAGTASAYEGSSFNQVWSAIKSDPYTKPQYAVTADRMFDRGKNLILQAANRTLSDHDDLLPKFTKLVHANGMCLRGQWHIDEASDYTGYFAKDAKALIIVRPSVAFSDTTTPNPRAFGFTAKLFPTEDPQARVNTANFFTIDDFGGTFAKHFLDTALTNAPTTTVRPDSVLIARIAAAVAPAFAAADLFPNIRQLYEISEAGIPAGAQAITPQRLRITASPGQPRIDQADFRDELNSQLYPDQTIHFDVAVSALALPTEADWKVIGHIDLTDSVVSESCDRALHFHHPRWRNDLKYTLAD